MNRCNYHDCFSCPYPDCISGTPPRGASKKRKKLSKDEAREHRNESNKKYWHKNRGWINEQRKKIRHEKAQKQDAERGEE